MKIYCSLFVFLLFAFSIAAETLDVTIKGVDDGAKTSRQQDYREAVLDAKRQAIEQAGVRVESRTTVINARVKEDFIESQAEAVLLPGFQIIDIGYTADGTYQVVLSGKVQLVPPEQPEEKPGVLALCMSNYAIPVQISINDGPLDGAGPFQAIALTPDSGSVRTYDRLRAFKKEGYDLCRYFLYVLKLAPGSYSIKCQADVIRGSGGAEHISKETAVEVKSEKYSFYEYLADPKYSFDLADRDFLLERLSEGNTCYDTTAAFRTRIRKQIAGALTAFGGLKF